jgi:hypothetical protein
MGRVFRHILTATALLGVVAGEGNTPSNAQNPSKNNNVAYEGTAIGGVVSGWTSAVANFLRARRDPSVNAVSWISVLVSVLLCSSYALCSVIQSLLGQSIRNHDLLVTRWREISMLWVSTLSRGVLRGRGGG